MRFAKSVTGLVLLLAAGFAQAQIDESQTGAWYMYFWNKPLENSRLGFTGDFQHRNWDSGGDLQQFLVRAGLTWAPEGRRERFTFGYAHFTFGAFGPSGDRFREDRLYQDIALPGRIGEKIFLNHRIRFEERRIDGRDWQTRVRYSFAINYPFNQDTLGEGAVYLSVSNETFLNLDRDFGTSQRLDRFDRNWLFLGIGYSLSDDMRLRFGYMNEQTSTAGKGQLQLALFQSF